ncbi:hypothetical protein ILYODFUR_027321, partial [Ilyodon furcidens]
MGQYVSIHIKKTTDPSKLNLSYLGRSIVVKLRKESQAETSPSSENAHKDRLCGCCPRTLSRKASLKDKVFPSPSKAPVVKGKALSPGAEDGAEASPSKVAKSWSRVRGSTSRQNSD